MRELGPTNQVLSTSFLSNFPHEVFNSLNEHLYTLLLHILISLMYNENNR